MEAWLSSFPMISISLVYSFCRMYTSIRNGVRVPSVKCQISISACITVYCSIFCAQFTPIVSQFEFFFALTLITMIIVTMIHTVTCLYRQGLRKVDGKVCVWRKRGDCCIERITAYGGGSVMIWGGISLARKTSLVVINGTLNAQRYRDKIQDPVAIPYVQNLGAASIIQDDNARQHSCRIVQHQLQQWMLWPACSPDLNPIEELWNQRGRVVHTRDTNATTLQDILSDCGGRVECYTTAACSAAHIQYEEAVRGCCSVWWFYLLLI